MYAYAVGRVQPRSIGERAFGDIYRKSAYHRSILPNTSTNKPDFLKISYQNVCHFPFGTDDRTSCHILPDAVFLN